MSVFITTVGVDIPLVHTLYSNNSHYSMKECAIIIIKIIVVCPSVNNGGQRKQFDLEKQEAASLIIEQQKLYLGYLSCECQSTLYLQAQTLASWRDRTLENQSTMDTCMYCPAVS